MKYYIHWSTYLKNTARAETAIFQQYLLILEISPQYYGTLIGKLSNKDEGMSGKIYAVDKNTVFVHNFTYTGENSRGFIYKKL